MLLTSDPARAATFVVNAWNELARPFDASCDPLGTLTDCLLRDAIAEANANPGSDTIVFAVVEPGFVGSIYLGRVGPPDDTNDWGDLDAWDTIPGSTLEIVGTGGLTIVSAQPWTERILHALPTSGSVYAVDVVLDGLTLSSGFETAGPGGCVLVEEGLLSTTDVIFEFCVSSQASYTGPGGGAVAAYGGAILAQTEVWNSAADNGDGGGVYVEGTLSVNDLKLMENATWTVGDGGGLAWRQTGGTATLGEVEAWNNTSIDEGAGLYLRSVGGTVSLVSSQIDNNVADGNGGGLWLHAQTASLSGVRLDGNSASNRGGGAFVVPGQGSGGLLMDQVSVVNNTAVTEGGGLAFHTNGYSTGTHVIRNSTVGHNVCSTISSGSPGCGLWLAAGAPFGGTGPGVTIMLQHVTVAHNWDDWSVPRALQVQHSGHEFQFENSIIEGRCEMIVPPPGVYTSLGGNVVHENPATGTQQQCASTATDVWPVLITAGSLWGSTPVLVGSPLPYYDPTLVTDAIDFTTCPTGVTVDQIGNSRPVIPGTCDAGAYEL